MKSQLPSLHIVAGVALVTITPTATAQCTYGSTPATHEQHAGWGTSVAMSGNGEVVLVGGPGAEGSDGIVRTFGWGGSSWDEKDSLFPDSQYAYGAWFGWSVALSYDGNTAAVGAPGDIHGDFVKRYLGAVYVFTRDPETGEWSQQARLVKPAPASNESFGQALALSDSGDVLVVGQRNSVGSEWAQVPDSAWVFTREAGVWSAPVELVGSDIAPADEFGCAVAVSPDGGCAAVGATGEGLTDGRVFVFRRDDAGWPLEQTMDYPEAAGWDSFGNAVALGDNVLMVGDELWSDPEWGTGVGAVHVFSLDGAEWERQPELLHLQGIWGRYGFGHTLALRGEYLLVGCPNADIGLQGEGAVHIVKVINGKWTPTGVIRAHEPQENSLFGQSVAITADRADYVVGDPWATVNGVEGEGRVDFANSVSAPYDFDIEPAYSNITITVNFLGYPVEIVISPYGELVGIVTDDCEDAGTFLLTDMALEANAGPIAFNLPPQMPEPLGEAEVILSDVRVTLAGTGEATTLDNDGNGMVVGTRLNLSGKISTGGVKPTPWEFEGEVPYLTVQLTGGYGEPFQLRLTDIAVTDLPIDTGLGDYNPTVTLRGTVGGTSTYRLRVFSCGRQAEALCLKVTGPPGLDVVVEACSDLTAPEWTPVHSATLGTDPLEITDPEVMHHTTRFYRVRSD